jgi:dTDP-glucose pyrophosphorylase
LVLAAGMGSRYGGLKQIDPIGPDGEIIIDFSVYDAVQAGFSKVVFVIRRDIEQLFREQVGGRFENIIDVEYAFQEIDELPDGYSVPESRTKPWGTGHAILMAESLIEGPFAVINADDFYGRSGFKLISEYLSQINDESSYCMVGFYLGNTLSEHGTVSRGVCCCDKNDNLKEVVERTSIRKTSEGATDESDPDNVSNISVNETVSMNMWGFSPSIFKHLDSQFREFLEAEGHEMKSEFFITSVVDRLIKEGVADVKALTSSDSWFGVTYPEDKPTVMKSIQDMMQGGKYPQPLF